MTGAVCYARVSTVEQAEKNNSLPVQNGKFKDHCDRNGLEILETFVDKQSARTTAKRPEFQRMMEFCKRNHKKISHVIVADLSRLARNVVDQGATIAALSQLGIQVTSIDEPITGDAAAGKLSRNIPRPRELPVTNHTCAIHPPLSSHPPDILEKLLKLRIGCAMGIRKDLLVTEEIAESSDLSATL